MSAPSYPRLHLAGRAFASVAEARMWAAVHLRERAALMQQDDAWSPPFVLLWLGGAE